MGGLAMIGAIAFDPTIRGILVVVVGTTVLMGSIFLILSTNSGVRVGFLLAATGFFSWMFLMGIIWVIYGIGLKGRDPAWMPTDISYTRETEVAKVPELAKLPAEEDLPDAEALVEERPLIRALVLGSENPAYEPSTLTKLKTVIQPMIVIEKKDLAPLARKTLAAVEPVEDDTPELEQGREILAGLLEEPSGVEGATVGQLLATGGDTLKNAVNSQSSALRDEIEDPLGGWCLLTESDPRRGEAQASADAALAGAAAFGDNTEPADYIVLDVFFFGGKEPCEPITEKSSLEQAWHRVATTFEVKNPKLLSAVTVVKTVDVVVADGEAPPPAKAEEGVSTVTVAMLRNLGNKRFIPFAFTIINLILFAFFAAILHYRDKNAMAVRAAFTGARRE